MKNEALGIIEERGMKEYFSDGKSEALLDEMDSLVRTLKPSIQYMGGIKEAEKAYSTILREFPKEYVKKCVENVSQYITLRNNATEGRGHHRHCTGEGAELMSESLKSVFSDIDENLWYEAIDSLQEHMKNHVSTIDNDWGMGNPFMDCAGYVVNGYSIIAKELPSYVAKEKFRELNKICPPRGPFMTCEKEVAWKIVAEHYKGVAEGNHE